MKKIISKIKKWLERPVQLPPNSGVYSVHYVTAPDGSKWKVFGDGKSGVPMIPAGRNFAAEIAVLMATNILTIEEQIQFYDKMEEMFNKGKIASMAQVLLSMKARAEMCQPIPSLLQLASVYIMYMDEDAETYIPSLCDKKIQEWNKSKDMQFFFARLGRNLIPGLPGISAGDFLTGMRVVEIHKRTIEEYISTRM